MKHARRKSIHDAIVRLSNGDRSALEPLLDDLWPALLSFAERGIGRTPDAEDVAQDALFKICQRTTDFDRTRDGLSWAFGIASYEILTHRRRHHRRREVFDEVLLAARSDGGVSPEEQLLAKEMDIAFEQTLRALSVADRESLGLASGQPSGGLDATLRKRKQRALDRLRSLWSQVYGES
jgi:RNA polymerase sigma-70 factor, ECF subfamily